MINSFAALLMNTLIGTASIQNFQPNLALMYHPQMQQKVEEQLIGVSYSQQQSEYSLGLGFTVGLEAQAAALVSSVGVNVEAGTSIQFKSHPNDPDIFGIKVEFVQSGGGYSTPLVDGLNLNIQLVESIEFVIDRSVQYQPVLEKIIISSKIPAQLCWDFFNAHNYQPSLGNRFRDKSNLIITATYYTEDIIKALGQAAEDYIEAFASGDFSEVTGDFLSLLFLGPTSLVYKLVNNVINQCERVEYEYVLQKDEGSHNIGLSLGASLGLGGSISGSVNLERYREYIIEKGIIHYGNEIPIYKTSFNEISWGSGFSELVINEIQNNWNTIDLRSVYKSAIKSAIAQKIIPVMVGFNEFMAIFGDDGVELANYITGLIGTGADWTAEAILRITETSYFIATISWEVMDIFGNWIVYHANHLKDDIIDLYNYALQTGRDWANDIGDFISETWDDLDQEYTKLVLSWCSVIDNVIEGIEDLIEKVGEAWNDFWGGICGSTDEGTQHDLDLHAYDSEGNHVGVNYETGEFEVQIEGVIYSGDVPGGEEYILIPDKTDITFVIVAKEAQEVVENYNFTTYVFTNKTFLVDKSEHVILSGETQSLSYVTINGTINIGSYDINLKNNGLYTTDDLLLELKGNESSNNEGCIEINQVVAKFLAPNAVWTNLTMIWNSEKGLWETNFSLYEEGIWTIIIEIKNSKGEIIRTFEEYIEVFSSFLDNNDNTYNPPTDSNPDNENTNSDQYEDDGEYDFDDPENPTEFFGF